jgi:hypothetical protein
MIWAKEPERTIPDLATCDEITRYGCENKIYHEETLRRWIKDLCPNRQPGRRSKKTPV